MILAPHKLILPHFHDIFINPSRPAFIPLWACGAARAGVVHPASSGGKERTGGTAEPDDIRGNIAFLATALQ